MKGEGKMNMLKSQKKISHEDEDTRQTICTNLNDLIEAVISSARPGEGHMTNFIVSHLLDAGNIQMSKELSENIRE